MNERMIAKEMETKAVCLGVTPGDGTLYRFVVTPSDYNPEYVIVANVEGLASGYDLQKTSIIEAFETVGKYGERDEQIDLPYVGYVAGHIGVGGKPCNPWTARAAIIAAYRALEIWGEV